MNFKLKKNSRYLLRSIISFMFNCVFPTNEAVAISYVTEFSLNNYFIF